MKSQLLYVVLFLITPFFSIAQVNESDSMALVDFYHAMDGPNWLVDTNWLEGPVSKWHGISVADGRVTRMDIRLNDLKGQLPESFYSMDQMISLSFLNDSIYGPLSQKIGRMKNLNSLSFQGCELEGEFPDSVGYLDQLGFIAFASCQFTGELPPSLGNLKQLGTLFFHGNQFTGPIPEEWKGMERMGTLNLANNQLTGVIPDSLQKLSRLRTFNAGGNNFDPQPFPEWLDDLDDLWFFQCYDCNLEGDLGDVNFRNNPTIRLLYLDGNRLSGDLSKLMPINDQTFSLNVNDNLFSGAFPGGDYNNLGSIDINRNMLDAIEPFTFKSMIRLMLSENQLDFDDFEPLAHIFTVDTVSFTLSPQDSLLEKMTITVQAGESVSLDAGCGGDYTVYQWVKNLGNLNGATERILTFDNVQPSDEGVYYCRITNDTITNTFLFRQPVTLLVEGTTSVKSVEETDQIQLYPNPTTDYIYLDVSPELVLQRLRIFNLSGQQVYSALTPGVSTRHQLSHLPAGTYSVLLEGPHVQYHSKIVKVETR